MEELGIYYYGSFLNKLLIDKVEVQDPRRGIKIEKSKEEKESEISLGSYGIYAIHVDVNVKTLTR